jgi:pimeloyl-ACP methyl ester carboxylesterase
LRKKCNVAVRFDNSSVLAALNSDPEFVLAARTWSATVRLDQDGSADDLLIVDGIATKFAPAVGDDYEVLVSGPETAWAQYLSDAPDAAVALAPGSGGLTVTGDLVEQIAPFGQAVRRVLELLRAASGVIAPVEHMHDYPFESSDVAIGRYVYYDVEGVRYRVYYEEAGEGIPLMLQHTAGADGRQWRHLLADPELQKSYRMIAYDLPYHGRSLPPLNGTPWWQSEYAPTKMDLLNRIVGLKRALGLDRPIFMGTSVGGQLAPEVVGHFPDDFRGAVSINGWYTNEWFGTFSNEPFHNPRISPEYWAGMMYDGSSPIAPEELRRENSWIYATGGPAVYKGDNEYFTTGHDLRVDGHLVDTTKTPLWAVVGEFDAASTSPGGTADIAKHIPGAKYQVLAGLSHFAMSDDPVRFNTAIKPILDDIVSQTKTSSRDAA